MKLLRIAAMILTLLPINLESAHGATYVETFTNGVLNTSITITQNGSPVQKNINGGDGVEAQYHNIYQGSLGMTGWHLNLHQVTTDVIFTFPTAARATSFSFIAGYVNGPQPGTYTYEDGTTVNFNVPDTVNINYPGYYTTFTVTGDGRAISSFRILGGMRDFWGMENLSWTAVSLTQSTTSISASNTASFNSVVSVSATVDTPGKITFFADGKRIAGCISLSITSSRTCSWKPKIHKAFTLTATLRPTDSNWISSSARPISVKVTKRTNKR